MKQKLIIILLTFMVTYQNCSDYCLKCDKDNKCLICDIINLKKSDGAGGCISLKKIENCKIYTVENVCIQCKKGYYLNTSNVNNNCILYPTANSNLFVNNCEIYYEFGCLYCSIDNYLNNSKCIKVTNKVNFCKYYNLKEQCTICKDGYEIKNGKCERIYDVNLKLDGCRKYNGLINCKKCHKYINNLDNKIYIKKSKNSIYENINNFSNNKIADILNSLVDTKNELYKAPICFISNIQYCITFSISNSNICDNCDVGYYLSENKTKCLKNPLGKIIGCKLYDSNLNCLECDNKSYYMKDRICVKRIGKFLSNCDEFNKSNNECLYCKTFFLKNLKGECESKIKKADEISNCIKWNSSNCLKCDTNFVLINNLCENKIDGCIEYTNKDNCQICDISKLYTKIVQNTKNICKKNTTLNCSKINNDNKCIQCTNNTILDDTGNCISRFVDCLFSNNISCTHCKENYILINYNNCNNENDPDCEWYNNNNCIRCKNNKKPNNNVCEAATVITNCELYDVAGNCVQCASNYGKPLADGTCSLVKLVTGCIEYKIYDINTIKCIKCFENNLRPIKIFDEWICRWNTQINNCNDDEKTIKDYDTCINCNNGYLNYFYNNSSICFNNPYDVTKSSNNNCLIKKIDGTCLQCVHGYILSANTCNEITNCDISNNDNYYFKYCKKCINNYILSQDKKKCISYNLSFPINSCNKYAISNTNIIYCYECNSSVNEKYLIMDSSLNINNILDFYEYNTEGDLIYKYNGSNYNYGNCVSTISNPQYNSNNLTSLLGAHIFRFTTPNHILVSCFKGYYYDSVLNKCDNFLVHQDNIILHPKYEQIINNNFILCKNLIQKPVLENNYLIKCDNYSNWSINNRDECYIRNGSSCFMCKKNYKNNSNGCEPIINSIPCKLSSFANFCNLCEIDKVLNNNYDNCVNYPFSIENCKILNKLNNSCEICLDGYIKKKLNSGLTTCIKTNIINCKIINNDNNCDGCNYNYSLSNPKNHNYCIKDEKSSWCKLYDNKTSKCLKCINENKTLSNLQDNCNYEVNGCLIMDSNNLSCMKCNTSKYYWKNNVCILGNKSNCLEYYNSFENSCNICKKGYFKYGVINNSFSCYLLPTDKNENCENINVQLLNGRLDYRCSCKNNLLLNTKTNNCSLRDIKNCSQYNGINCLKCKEKYFLLNNFCENIIPIENCLKYKDNVNSCKICKEDYYYNESKNQCIKNPIGITNCIKYKDLNTCIMCNNQSYLLNDICVIIKTVNIINYCINYDNKEICIQCKKGYYLESSIGQCIKVNFNFENCKIPKSLAQCQICDDNYFLNPLTNICEKINNCKEYFLNGNKYNCRYCNDYYYLSDNSCIKGKINFCRVYNSANECEICEKNTILSTLKNYCNPIEYNDIINYCDVYEYNSICTLCDFGRSLNSLGVCVNCNSDCLICDPNVPSNCLICKNGYYMNQGLICIKNSINQPNINTINNTSNSNNIIKLILGFLIIFK